DKYRYCAYHVCMGSFFTSPEYRASGQDACLLAKRQAKKLGVTIDAWFPRGEGHHEIVITAPDGTVFGGTEHHEHRIANAGATTDGLWERVLEDLQFGIKPCEVDGCEWCHGD